MARMSQHTTQHIADHFLIPRKPGDPASCVAEPAPLQDGFADAPSVFRAGTGRLALTSALLLLALGACAQTTTPVTSSSTTATPPAAPEPAAAPQAQQAPALQAPAYTASNIMLAFDYIDTNKDGQLSREEAAGFRGVAKNFDAADTNKDGNLSRQEFENAMNRSKPK